MPPDMPFGLNGTSVSAEVSVVIPIHNKAKYVAACLESVLNQTGATIEVICIDDCSTDESAEIVKEYAARYPQVQLAANRTRLGAGQSRNRGIEVASGTYLQFTDADDLLPEDAIVQLVGAARRTNADVVKGNLMVLRNGATASWPTGVITSERAGSLLELPEVWIPWFHICCLISRQLIIQNRIRYPELSAGEDPVFLATVLTSARRVCAIPSATYIYRENQSRPQPTSATVQDYLHHAELVRAVYDGAHVQCWESYRPFVKEDIKLLVSQANLSQQERAAFDRAIDLL